MTTGALVKPKELMAEHLAALRAHARRVVLQGEILQLVLADDKLRRMREFLAAGSSFKLTEKEMVALIFRGLFTAKLQCGCATCRGHGSWSA